jgi:hypothetical protein
LLLDPVSFIKETNVLPLYDENSETQIDMIFSRLPFELDAIKRAVIKDIDTVKVRICTAEDLILYKIISERQKDRSDVENLIRRNRDNLDRDYLDPRVKEMAVLFDRPDIFNNYKEAAESKE